ncbi:MAG: GNAT family N-acetyltransferase [Oscillospiraceae bacterium]|nr:GNAT family N-acetyltransferase [Oscillospiraceae bacterium]
MSGQKIIYDAPNFTTRTADPADLNAVQKLYSQLYDKEQRPTEQVLAQWQKLLSYDNIYVILTEQNGIPISTCCLTIIPSITQEARPYALIEYVVTDSSHRRTGAGKACLDYARQLAVQQNCYKIMLITSRPEAHAFYKACGYSPEGRTAFLQYL